MHLLAATPGTINDGSEAVDLGQSPGDILILSSADSELACLSTAFAAWAGDKPTLRLANLMRLAHPMSVDLYVDDMVAHAKLVIVRLLGGRSYWDYGVEEITALCRARGILLAWLPGDAQPDAELTSLSTADPEAVHRLWRYLLEGGVDNAEQMLRYAGSLIGRETPWREPCPLPPAGVLGTVDGGDGPRVALVFYRALMQAGSLSAMEALIGACRAEGLAVTSVFVTSLKDPLAAAVLEERLRATPPDVILNTTGFSVAAPGDPRDSVFSPFDCPVLQVVLAGSSRTAWEEGVNGLSAKDIAMNVALPEVDGRILTRAVAFKGTSRFDAACQCDVVEPEPVADRIAFTAGLAAAWARLRRTAPKERRVALILANYPNRDGRLGNGVGLDTPASAVGILRHLAAQGYTVGDIPENGNALMSLLQQGPTNALAERGERVVTEYLSLADYRAFFARLPQEVQVRITARWGKPEADPFYTSQGFALAVRRFGHIALGVQPARGYNIDPTASAHDPALVPPHGYLAFYAWLREGFNAHALIHLGKHGNLEWLPGKSLALSSTCFPEIALGPLPHLYPFIVNDPGEGTQAKRRAAAVIVDHLTPPLTRAESYGPLRDLETLVDEYYEAAGVDPRRLKLLRGEILSLTHALGLDADLGISAADDADAALSKLDSHLCELKEMQIRDGLHIFGRAPEDDQLTDLLVALARVPRGGGQGKEASVLRALAQDLALGVDPLSADLGAPYAGPRPEILASATAWRTLGDTVERLEALARDLVRGATPCPSAWSATVSVLAWMETELRPAVAACGPAELDGLTAGLDGRFVPPGPSGAPTRGRPDVLPTGRNFYSVDTRAVPTPSAWSLGWASATQLIERHAQEHGDWPRAVALSAWGTSNMRTGGDDIAQGLALMGVRPTWDAVSRRVTGFEVLPVTVLGRPRVDVTLRISGFFRDAFPNLIELFDSAARAVARQDESDADNPLRARVQAETAALIAQGLPASEAERRAGFRVFGSQPGAYGAGLQALIDEKGWTSRDDLAKAFVAWGGFAYGDGAKGDAQHGLFRARLKQIEAVIQNQDNREHDLLDSDDYYQFEGGLTAAVQEEAGRAPITYHPDHSRPESPRIRTLEEEIARVVRARAANPKWIAGVMRHGYKGAFEMTATVDYLFAFAATTSAVKDHHFDALYAAYLGDETVLAFLRDNNPAALAEMQARFAEARARGLWTTRRNDVSMLE